LSPGAGRPPGPPPPPAVTRVDCITSSMPLDQVMERLLASRCPLPVVDSDGCYRGAVSQHRVLSILSKQRNTHV